MLTIQLFLGTVMILINVLLHVSMYEGIMILLARHTHLTLRVFGRLWRPVLMTGIVLGVFLCHIISIWSWAALLLVLDIHALKTLEESLYFALVSYTTIGYGDITLDQNWRLLGAFAGANGVMLLGWSTAFLYEVISKLHYTDRMKP